MSYQEMFDYYDSIRNSYKLISVLNNNQKEDYL
jgi:hypothetical protein